MQGRLTQEVEALLTKLGINSPKYRELLQKNGCEKMQYLKNTTSKDLPSGLEAGGGVGPAGCQAMAGRDLSGMVGLGAKAEGARARSSASLGACAGSDARLSHSWGSERML